MIETRGIRNRNPGNIDRTSDHWLGMSADQSSDSRFVVFDEPVYGLRAMAIILKKRLAAGQNTVDEIISRWAPGNENDTDAYIESVCKSMGCSDVEPLTHEDLPALMKAIVQHENGQQPYPDELFTQALEMA